MNANIFDPDDYALQTTLIREFVRNKWTWRANIYGMPIQCAKYYSSSRGAYKAGENWLRKYIHDTEY